MSLLFFLSRGAGFARQRQGRRRFPETLVGFAFLREENFMRRIVAAVLLSLFLSLLVAAQTAHRVAIRAGKLIDGRGDKPIENALILIEGDKIVSVTPGGSAPSGTEVIDLSRSTVLPGFIDAHTHVLLQGDITAEEYDEQLLKQSIPYRAILAARNARIALSHGFTAIRDLETEGAMYADGARRAVREQAMYGADWIKYYSDRRYHFEFDGVLHSMVNFTDEEAKAIVDEAHRIGKKVAAHAIGSDGIAAE